MFVYYCKNNEHKIGNVCDGHCGLRVCEEGW